jgi:hypothetical protein
LLRTRLSCNRSGRCASRYLRRPGNWAVLGNMISGRSSRVLLLFYHAYALLPPFLHFPPFSRSFASTPPLPPTSRHSTPVDAMYSLVEEVREKFKGAGMEPSADGQIVRFATPLYSDFLSSLPTPQRSIIGYGHIGDGKRPLLAVPLRSFPLPPQLDSLV